MENPKLIVTHYLNKTYSRQNIFPPYNLEHLFVKLQTLRKHQPVILSHQHNKGMIRQQISVEVHLFSVEVHLQVSLVQQL